MKNTSLFRRILSVVLVLTMIGTLLVPMASAEPEKSATVEELTLTPIDAGALEPHKLGETKTDDSIDMEDHALTDVVRVSIVLDKASTLGAGFSAENIAENAAAKVYREGLRADQAAMTAKIEKAIGGKLDVKWNLTLAANIISANVLYGQIDAIKAVDGVKDVFLENRYEPEAAEKEDEPNNGSASYMIGSNITWANGYTGAGSKVAVIDTGADSSHQSFAGEGLEYALGLNAEAKGMSYEDYVASLNLLTPESIEAVKDQLNADIGSGEAAYRNTKIGYGYDYIDGDVSYIEHINDTQGEHGSHVSGIATGNRFIQVGEEFKPALEVAGTQGVAPDAQLVVMKVFGKGGGAYDSDYMSAIEDAIVLGCDSANLSLGSGSAGFSFSSGYQEVMDKLVENSMVVAMSAGNSYGWYDTPYDTAMYPYLYADDVNYATGGSPGSFTNSLTVASVNNKGQTGMPLLFGDLHVFYSQTSGYGNEPITTLGTKEYEYVLIDGPGVDDNEHVGAEGDDFMALGSDVLKDKIAMCFRGSSSFFAKCNAAVAQGAAGVIIINNVDGVINMNLTGYNYTAPAVSILLADGLAIMDQSEVVETESGLVYYTGTMSVGDSLEVQVPEISDTVEISAFSSWGTPGSMVLKPEILAPGGSIYSVNGLNSEGGGHDQYEVMSGTSMASPQVAGMAAVMGQYIRDNDLETKTGKTARQLTNSLLMSTAHPVFDSYGDYWPVIRVGAGLGNVADATAAKSFIMMEEGSTMFADSALDGKVKAELGDDPDCTGEYSYSFTIYPMEGKKDFTLRTDIFTQYIAGNGGYGLLQDQATLMIGAETTYEINGETYEDSYLIEADVNMDGVTDQDDAQAILDYLTGNLAEGAPFDDKAADVDGDSAITSYDAKLILDSAATPIVSVSEPTKVTVNIKVDEEWKELLLANYFVKGFYVQGYTYVDPVADEEGVMDVVHSIPIYGFCGNWTNPSMLDRTSTIDEAYGTGKRPYIKNTNTNYLSMKDPDGAAYTYMGNPYAVEDVFPADKLAMNSGATIQSYNYVPIRNSATQGFAVLSEDGEVVYVQSTPSNRFAPYYYVNGGAWQNTGAVNYNVAKKLSAMGVKENEKYTVGFYVLPEYYAVLNSEITGEKISSGGLDADGLKNMLEAGVIGDGAGIFYDVVIDDTAPEVMGAYRDLITGAITVKASDNQYIAYVGIRNGSGSKEYLGIVPEQDEPGQELEIPLELEGIKLPNEVTLLVGDYAGNEVAFKVSLGSSEEDTDPIMIGFVRASTTAAPGAGNRAWEIDRDGVWYDYSSGVYEGLNVYSSVPAAVTAAEYVDGYAFMAAEDGWFYAADVNALDEAARVGKFSDKVDAIYDMAFNYKDNTLYVLGNNNVIYTMDLITGKLTPAIKVTLPDMSSINAEVNRLAIDDNNTFYVANYGATYSGPAKLYKFTYTAPVPAEEGPEAGDAIYSFDFETDPLAAGWKFVDLDNDNYNWAWNSNYSTANDGVGVITSYSYQNGARQPDNWAVTPAIDLSNVENASFSFWAKSMLSSWPETYAIYAGTTDDVAEMTMISEDANSPSGWMQITASLADFEGESNVYVAIRHYNCYDEYAIVVDTVNVFGTKITEEPEPEPVEPEVEPEEIIPEAVGSKMGVYNYSKGGAFTWDHEKGVLYLASNYNNTQDYDHYLWIVDTNTGVATKANSANSSYSARLYGAVTGLFIIPGVTHIVQPADEATELIVEPEVMNLLKGQTGIATAAVMPWTLSDKEVTWESADPAIATVRDGVVTGVEVGETTITVTTSAEPHLTKEIAVTVGTAPEAELRGVIWDANGKGMASVFNTNAPAEWTGDALVGNFVWGALVDDTYYASDDDTMYAVDADTYEVTTLGGIVSMWIPSDADNLPADLPAAWGITGRVVGLCNNGTYFEVLDPEEGKLNYWDMSSNYSEDPMVTIAYAGRGDYTDSSGDPHPNSAFYYVMTEGGMLYCFILDQDGYLIYEELGRTPITLSGFSDVTGNNRASMTYVEENGFLYIAVYDGNGEIAVLYALDTNDLNRCAVTGDFGAGVWPVVGLYQYEPATDLVLKVDPTELELFETQSAEISIKVKMGETNEYNVEVEDPEICSFEDGVVTGLKEGETDIIVTTVDANEASVQLTEKVHVVVKSVLALNLTVKGQVTDDKGARFTTILLDGPTASARGPEAPFDLYSGGRCGDLYLAATDSQIVALDANTFEPVNSFDPDPEGYFSTYPAMDIANYPEFFDEDGNYVEDKALFTTNLGWIVKPNFYGWNLSSYLPDMAAICFGGMDENLYIYYVLTTAGELWEVDIDFAAGSIDGLYDYFNTGITVEDAGNLSMAFAYGVDAHYGSEDEETYGLVIANNEDKCLWFIDFQTGEVGMVGTLDAENVSGLIGYYDEMVTSAENAPVDPFEGVEPDLVIDFEDGADDWTFVDKDGDGYGWATNHDISSWFSGTPDFDSMPYEGTGCICSASFINTVGVLYPDNWAVSPALNLKNAEHPVFSFFAKGLDSSYPAENFAIYAGTSTDPDAMIKVAGDFTGTANWKRYYADLSAFAGEETVYVAIRHYDISDMYIILVDEVEIFNNVELGGVGGFVDVEPMDFSARDFNGKTVSRVGSGAAIASVAASMDFADFTVEMSKVGEAVNAVVGGTNAITGGLVSKRALADDTAVADGTATIVLTEDEVTANGLLKVEFDPEILTFVSALSDVEIYSVRENEGVILFAYASAEDIEAGTPLATLTFSFEGEVDTNVTVTTLERYNDVAVEEDALVIPIVFEGHDCQISHFTDIEEYPYGTVEHDAIEWAFVEGITAGTGDGTTFEPGKTVTRAEAMVFLYAAEGRPAYEKPDKSFTDVKKKHWAYDAIMWAVANGITGGTGDGTTFEPNKTCTRAEILQFFYAAEGKPEYSISNPYSDVKNKHWYKDAAIWAYENGLEKGEGGKFLPNTDCTRLSTVLYLYRYITGEGRLE